MIKEFEKVKAYLSEKNAKLSMVAKTQERMALYMIKKMMKMAVGGEEKKSEAPAKKKKGAVVEESKAPEEIPFAPEDDEEEEEAPQAFDNTLENLMTIE
jgi:hypothetical protein